MVSNPACAEFIAKLINLTATATNPAEFTDALTGFKLIKGQRGFVYGDTVRRTDGYDAGTVHGSIHEGSAQVELPFPIPFRSFGPVNKRAAADYTQSQAAAYAMTTLHEILHLAGRYGYSDLAFARAVAEIKGVKPPDYSRLSRKEAVYRASRYWGDALRAACKPE